MGPGELVRGHRDLGRPLVEAVCAEHDLAGLGRTRRRPARRRGQASTSPATRSRPSVTRSATRPSRPWSSWFEPHDDQLRMAEAEQADRVRERRLVRLLSRPRTGRRSGGADELGQAGVLLVEPGDRLRVVRHADSLPGAPTGRHPARPVCGQRPAPGDERWAQPVRHARWTPARRRVLPDEAVHGLAQQVGVPGVPAVLLDQVADEPAQAGVPAVVVGDVDELVEPAVGQRRVHLARDRSTAPSQSA